MKAGSFNAGLASARPEKGFGERCRRSTLVLLGLCLFVVSVGKQSTTQPSTTYHTQLLLLLMNLFRRAEVRHQCSHSGARLLLQCSRGKGQGASSERRPPVVLPGAFSCQTHTRHREETNGTSYE